MPTAVIGGGYLKVVILAGGFGTRIGEETHLRPKPMVEIGGMPILWHIMKYYASFGHRDFIICAGYRQNAIKEWFADYYINQNDVTFDLVNEGRVIVHGGRCEPWRVTVVDTGLSTMTGGRVARVARYLAGERFFLTYGDGLTDADLDAELAFHHAHGRAVTLLAARPDARFGVMEMVGDEVRSFREKSRADVGRINGGFMIVEPRVLDAIEGDATVWERDVLPSLSEQGEVMGYRHDGFWQCMDTMRDKECLERIWLEGRAPWQRWRREHEAIFT